MNKKFYLSKYLKNLIFAIISLNILIGCKDNKSEKVQEQNQEQHQEQHSISEEKPKPLDGMWNIVMIQGLREVEQKIFSQYFTKDRRSNTYVYKTAPEHRGRVEEYVFGQDRLSLTFYVNRGEAELRFKNINPDHQHFIFNLPFKVNYLDFDQISIEANSDIQLTEEDRDFFTHWRAIGNFPFNFSPYPENLDWSHSLSGSYQIQMTANQFTLTEVGKGIILVGQKR